MLHHRSLPSFCPSSAQPLTLCAPLDYCPTSAQPWIKVCPQPNSSTSAQKLPTFTEIITTTFNDWSLSH
ncbi:unnamed protein product [Caenorhabditis nigoni]